MIIEKLSCAMKMSFCSDAIDIERFGEFKSFYHAQSVKICLFQMALCKGPVVRAILSPSTPKKER